MWRLLLQCRCMAVVASSLGTELQQQTECSLSALTVSCRYMTGVARRPVDRAAAAELALLCWHSQPVDLYCRCMAGVARSPVARAAAANLVVTSLAILINNYRGASTATLASSLATIAVEATATLGGEPDGMVHSFYEPYCLCLPWHPLRKGASCNQHKAWRRWMVAIWCHCTWVGAVAFLDECWPAPWPLLLSWRFGW